MVAIWDRIAAEGLDKIVFLDGDVSTPFHWLEMAKRPSNVLHVASDEQGRPGIVAWLNNIHRNWGQAHFLCFRSTWGKESLALGQETLEHWFDTLGMYGYQLDTIIGNIPAQNRAANAYVKKLGFVRCGSIPGIAWDSRRECSAPMVVNYLTRDQWEAGNGRR